MCDGPLRPVGATDGHAAGEVFEQLLIRRCHRVWDGMRHFHADTLADQVVGERRHDVVSETHSQVSEADAI